MKYDFRCSECLIRQMLFYIENHEQDSIRRLEITNCVLETMSRHRIEDAPPLLAKKLNALVYEYTGEQDPYRDIKQKSNEFALSFVPFLNELIAQSSDHILSALKIAINGNLLDYGAKKHICLDEIKDSLKNSIYQSIDPDIYESFLRDLDRSERILYICDNAGEIVLDRLFMEYLPYEKITAVVKGAPAINDAMIDDASACGLQKLCHVITTGDATPGVDYVSSGNEFKEAVRNADMLILKGQGNYETAFSDSAFTAELNKNAVRYFLFKVKCRVIADETGKDTGSTAMIRLPQ